MKRTAELTLTIIGLVLSLASVAFTGFITIFFNTDFSRQNFEEGYNEGVMEMGESVNPGEADSVLNIMLTFGWIIIVVFIIAIITSAISIYFYIGNKKPKAASIMMIITGVVVGLGTALTGFLPALLFLIAGIVGLVRKPPKDPIAIEA
ncbi:MAG TPA: DUF4064 domain-containing protein [Pseudogracilibacillus sp.]|nr:DUF4064 domain-containing protein [Pseudogracilibacillus sp.]